MAQIIRENRFFRLPFSTRQFLILPQTCPLPRPQRGRGQVSGSQKVFVVY
ncbi:hypothetical protein [Wielerella bovis]|nr:hypothetical protein [Wielerella bovis]MCG7657624.1 hypothetical protein [Wielerella bovis]MCG7659845.1 hypothetical protein [Wielerella bovis]